MNDNKMSLSIGVTHGLALLVLGVANGDTGTGAAAGIDHLGADERAMLQAIRTSYATTGRFDQEDIAHLRSLTERHPDLAEVALLYDSALRATQDWNGLIALHSRTSLSDKSPQERLFLAELYLQAKRFAGAAKLLDDAGGQLPPTPQWAWLKARATFGTGDHKTAAKILDDAWDALMRAEEWDALLIRGLIHLHAGGHEAAQNRFAALLARYPDHIPGNLAMARCLHAQGRGDEAHPYLDRASAVRDQVNAAEQERARFIALLFALQDAQRARRWDECERLILAMLETADVAQEIELTKKLRQVRAQAAQDQSLSESADSATDSASHDDKQ